MKMGERRERRTWDELTDSDMEEVFVDDAISEGSDWRPTPGDPTPTWGPPPPSPVAVDMDLSHRISCSVSQTFLQLGLPKSLPTS